MFNVAIGWESSADANHTSHVCHNNSNFRSAVTCFAWLKRQKSNNSTSTKNKAYHNKKTCTSSLYYMWLWIQCTGRPVWINQQLTTCHSLTIAATTTTKDNGANLQLLCIPQGVTRNCGLLCLGVNKHPSCSVTGSALLLSQKPSKIKMFRLVY